MTRMTREQIISKLASLMPRLAADYGVLHLDLFGSVARGDFGDESDVDVLLTFRPDAIVTLFTYAGVKDLLEEELGREVDVVEDLPSLRESFKRTLQKERLRVA